MSKITKDGLTWSGTGCFIGVFSHMAIVGVKVLIRSIVSRQTAVELWQCDMNSSHLLSGSGWTRQNASLTATAVSSVKGALTITVSVCLSVCLSVADASMDAKIVLSRGRRCSSHTVSHDLQYYCDWRAYRVEPSASGRYICLLSA